MLDYHKLIKKDIEEAKENILILKLIEFHTSKVYAQSSNHFQTCQTSVEKFIYPIFKNDDTHVTDSQIIIDYFDAFYRPLRLIREHFRDILSPSKGSIYQMEKITENITNGSKKEAKNTKVDSKLVKDINKHAKNLANNDTRMKSHFDAAVKMLILYNERLDIKEAGSDQKTFTGFRTSLIDQQKEIIELTSMLINSLKLFKQFMTEAHQSLESVCKLFNPRNELMAFARKNGIVRFDLEPLKFRPLMNIPEVELKLPRPINTDIYPCGLSCVVREFLVKDKNMLNCIKSRVLYILEHPNEPWILAMEPLSKRCGFVPRAAIAPIGRGCGIIKKDTVVKGRKGTIEARVGNFVALFHAEQGYYLVETIGRVRGRIPCSHVEELCIFKSR